MNLNFTEPGCFGEPRSCLNPTTKFLMRVGLFYSFLVLFSIQLLMAHSGRSQALDSISVTVELRNENLRKLFRIIEKQTGLLFAYQPQQVDDYQRITLPMETRSVKETLDMALKDTSLRYRQVNNSVIIFSKGEKSFPAEFEKQVISISGIVSDDLSNPIPGVNVLVKGTTNGTTTDFEGKYSLVVSEEAAVLVFSFIGYITQEVPAAGRSVIDVVLTEDVQNLEEVVVVGYGTQKKSDLTGSVARANIDAFRESPNVNIAQSLQGSVPGLNVGQVSSAGQSPSISIRGATTISGSRNVLLVVDGIIYTGRMSDLNPNDIASIDVLKDPSSMAIFGAQAANGVLLITTKGGGKKSLKPVFNYTGSYTTQDPTNSLTLMDREAFLEKSANIDYKQSYMAPDYTQPNPDYTYMDVVNDVPLREGYENGTDYDWWDNTTNPGYISSHNLSVRGSGEQTSYFISGGYTKQKGFVMNDRFKRITTRVNLENQILKWFKLGTQTFASFSDYSGVSPALGGIVTMTPLVKPVDDEGNYILNPTSTNVPNPFLISAADDFDKRNNLFGNFYADIDVPFVKGLNYRLNFGNNYSWTRQYTSSEYANGAAGGASKYNDHAYDWTLDNIVSYKRTFNDIHNLNLTLVAGRRERDFESTTAEGINYNSLRLRHNDLSLGTIQNINSSAWDESYVYQMGRINYEFKYKYILTATVRRDGFSGFADNNKTAIFPSFGFGWVLSEEEFVKKYNSIDQLKLRGSYGANGNLVDRYSSLASLSTYPAYVFGDGGSTAFGQSVLNLANPNLSWETTTGYNFGLDFSVLQNKFSGSVDYYHTTTNDLLFRVNIPEITGFNDIMTNVGEVANRGVEVMLNSNIVDTRAFTWSLNLNMASNRNRIVSLLGLDDDGDGVEDDLVASGLFIGESINTIYDYESAGIIQLNDDVPSGFFVGTHRIVDQNADGNLDANDRVIRGREEPAYNFGILNEFTYRNFTLRIFINSIQGGKDGYLRLNMPNGGSIGDNIRRNNMYREVDYWTPLNPGARYRALDQAAALEYNYYGDRSFVRLQDVTLAYALGQPLADKLGLQNAKLFLNGKNLLTWTKWQGWDPETGVGLVAGMPVMRGFTLGLDLSF